LTGATLIGAELGNADLEGVTGIGTRWPKDFNPAEAGVLFD
jgi:hypothetical protein